jgi:Transglutaminase-like superfamily
VQEGEYERSGLLTAIDDDVAALLVDLPDDPVQICGFAQGLLVLPDIAAARDIPEERLDERSIRPASEILRVAATLDPRPFAERRGVGSRVVGTCRHFAVVSCALLRHRGIAARARCGFASYFVEGSHVDHWVVELRPTGSDRWVRVDPEILGFGLVPDPADLAPGAFFTGGEAWALVREGGADPSTFGVHGVPEAWGVAEIRGNAVRDLAALNKVEVLPWDEWGRMEASYAGTSGRDYDDLMDAISAVTASDDIGAIADLYSTEDLPVPSALLATWNPAGSSSEPSTATGPDAS